LRSLEEQHEIYKECRRLKKGGNKNKPEDWELIPPAERVGKWGAKNEPMWTEAPGMSVPVLVAMPRVIPLAPNCPVFKSKKAGNVVYEFMGPVTWVWQSYHNLGLAVDLVERIRDPDNKQKTKEALPNNPEGGTGQGFHEATMAWYNLLRAAEALGMRAGIYWRGEQNDPAHYEWHPKIHDINNAPAPKTPGKALNDDQVDAGYAWKIPQKLYVTSSIGLSQASIDLATTVFELVEDHGWIAIIRYHSVRGVKDKQWSGHWVTFDPPVRLFPAYIPTVYLKLGGRDEPKWYGVTTMTEVSYHQNQQNGDYKSYSQTQGRIPYFIEGRMTDLLKKGDVATNQNNDKSNLALYSRVRDHYVYEVQAAVRIREDAKWQSQGRQVFGCGSGRDEKSEGFYRTGNNLMPELHLGWDRDSGTVGYAVANVGSAPIDIVQNPVETVSGNLPQGAWDSPVPPGPPAWAPPCPAPPKSSPCPPGKVCMVPP
jgi:hypothetical protein